MTMFVAIFENVTVSAIQDLWELNTPSTGPVCIHRCIVGQTSDFGDAQEEQLRIRFIQGFTTSGSGGSTVTPTELGLGTSSFAGTVEANNTTPASGGTTVTKHIEPWNVRTTFDYLPTPETRILVPASTRLVINLPAAPADALSVSSTLIFEV